MGITGKSLLWVMQDLYHQPSGLGFAGTTAFLDLDMGGSLDSGLLLGPQN